jgi:hypothetical protein
MCHHQTYRYRYAPAPRSIAQRPLRAGDADRERVVEDLRRGAAEGRLDAEELERRVEAVYAATYVHEAEAQVADLPVTRRDHPGAHAPAPPVLPVFLFALVLIAIAAAATGIWSLWLLAWPASRLLLGGDDRSRMPVGS